MIKRSLATVAVAGLTFAAPVAAFAGTDYPAPEAGVTCDSTQVAPNESFNCTVTGEGTNAALQATTSGENASIDIAGTETSADNPLVDGEASFVVTAPSVEGTIGITGLIDGEAVGTADVDVAEELSGTGFDSMPLAVGAGVLLVAGAAVVFVGARRRSAQNA
ncbi:hypothetical protein [Demequina sp.]|uniref:hypothetical protein n=1 Tax=Demequina sp. TaxID=2050685 RepID=UPI003D11FB7A